VASSQEVIYKNIKGDVIRVVYVVEAKTERRLLFQQEVKHTDPARNKAVQKAARVCAEWVDKESRKANKHAK
jgi:hypothetical protein